MKMDKADNMDNMDMGSSNGNGNGTGTGAMTMDMGDPDLEHAVHEKEMQLEAMRAQQAQLELAYKNEVAEQKK